MSWWYGLKEYRYEKRNVTHHCSHTLPLNFVCILVLYAGTTNQQCRLNDPVHVFGLAIITNSCSTIMLFSDASLCTCQAVNQCVGGPTQKLLSKSRLFTCPDDCNTLMVAAGDESLSSVSFPQALVYSSFIMFLCSECYLQCCTWSLNTSGVAKSDDKFNPFTFKISRITLFPHMYQQLLTMEGLCCLISEAW